MNRRGGIVAGAVLAGVLLGAAGARAADDRSNRTAIEAVVRDYILAHPEIIPEAMEQLRNRETTKLIAADRAAIETPFAGAWAGNPKGDVTLVMFTDYNCTYCRASAPDIDRLLAEDPKLKVVWREIPVLGPASEAAARTALAAAKQPGRYLPFHRALFGGGPIDDARIAAAARGDGLNPAKLAEERGAADIAHELDTNIALATRLGVTGTPAFVIGDKMLSGAVGHDAIAAAIASARRE